MLVTFKVITISHTNGEAKSDLRSIEKQAASRHQNDQVLSLTSIKH